MNRLTFSWRWPRVVVVGLVAALLATVAQQGWAWWASHERVAEERAAIAAASDEVVGLVSISGATSREDLDRLLDGATASFRSDLEDQSDRLLRALEQGKVTATGEVVSAGVSSIDEDTATVVVAAAGTVRNKGTAKAEPRSYRLRVDLAKEGDRWLVSGLEFVA